MFCSLTAVCAWLTRHGSAQLPVPPSQQVHAAVPCLFVGAQCAHAAVHPPVRPTMPVGLALMPPSSSGGPCHEHWWLEVLPQNVGCWWVCLRGRGSWQEGKGKGGGGCHWLSSCRALNHQHPLTGMIDRCCCCYCVVLLTPWCEVTFVLTTAVGWLNSLQRQ